MQARRFGRKVVLPSTISIKHQVLMRMHDEAVEREKLETVAAASPSPAKNAQAAV